MYVRRDLVARCALFVAKLGVVAGRFRSRCLVIYAAGRVEECKTEKRRRPTEREGARPNETE